jgi:hypothetical protein
LVVRKGALIRGLDQHEDRLRMGRHSHDFPNGIIGHGDDECKDEHINQAHECKCRGDRLIERSDIVKRVVYRIIDSRRCRSESSHGICVSPVLLQTADLLSTIYGSESYDLL